MTALFSSQQITSAETITGTSYTGFGRVREVTVQWKFAFGSGGGTVKAYLQTSIDGVTWWDIACIALAAASETKYQCCVMSAVGTPVALTDGALTDDTAINGFLGTQFRAKAVVAGTAFAGGTTLSCDIEVKA